MTQSASAHPNPPAPSRPRAVPPVEPEPGGLARYARKERPAPKSRGNQGLWLERFGQILDEVPGQWVNATEAWGVTSKAAGGMRTALKRYELNGEVIVGHDGVWIYVR